MEASKHIDITKTDVDYRKLDKSTMCALSQLLSNILTKYGCTYMQGQKFTISDASNEIRENFDRFDELFDNNSIYDAYSLMAYGRTSDKSKQLDIVVGVEFKYSEPNCHITIISEGISPAQQTDIIDRIDKFIYEATKVESPEQSPPNINKTGKTVDNNQDKKPRLPKAVILIFKIIGAIGTIAAAIVAVYEAYGIFF